MTHQSKNNSVVLGARLVIAIGLLGLLEAMTWGQENDEGGGIAAIGSSISYQGVIKQGGTPINGICDLQFSLWNALSGPSQVGPTNQFLSQSITNGLFVDSLDFGAGAFDGNDRWIEIAVRFPAGSGSYTTMTPRQKVSAVPYALWSLAGAGGGAFSVPYSATVPSGSALLALTNNASGDFLGQLGGFNFGARGTHGSTGNDGVLGTANYGVFGSALGPNGHAVHGIGDYGVWGESPNAGGRGVVGYVTGSGDAVGVLGLHSPTGNSGKLGTSNYGVEAHGAPSASGALHAETISNAVWATLAQPNCAVRAFIVAYGNCIHATNLSGGVGRLNTTSAIFGETNTQSGVRGQRSGDDSTFGVLGWFPTYYEDHAGVYGKSDRIGVSAEGDGGGIPLVATLMDTPGDIAVFRTGYTNEARIDQFGRGYFNGGTQTGGADVAEAMSVEGDAASYGPADVLEISADSDRTVTKSQQPYSTLVAGVYATKPGVLLTDAQIDNPLIGTVPVGVVGIIPTKVSAENGAIKRGDLLVTSSIPGHAMKGTDRDRMLGAIIGKALENFDGDAGVIKVMVNVK